MSISISYSTTYSGWTVADYLADWSAYFGDVNHRPGQVVDGSNTGGFNPGPFDGSQYALKSTASDAAVIAGGDLHYTLFSNPSHTLWGKLDSIALGDTLPAGADRRAAESGRPEPVDQLHLRPVGRGRRRPCHPGCGSGGNRRGRRAGTAARPGPGGLSNCPR